MVHKYKQFQSWVDKPFKCGCLLIYIEKKPTLALIRSVAHRDIVGKCGEQGLAAGGHYVILSELFNFQIPVCPSGN